MTKHTHYVFQIGLVWAKPSICPAREYLKAVLSDFQPLEGRMIPQLSQQ